MTQTCFIDMPFGSKPDLQSGVLIDFDDVYRNAIRPAVEASGLECIRGDHEQTGGIIHQAMFARLLLSEFVIADLTTANPNVFYELGVRHAARPYTTIPIFATTGDLPFDVGMVRAIPYTLTDGKLSEASADALKQAIIDRIQYALNTPVHSDSPLFQLFAKFPGIEISHELTDVFMDRTRSADAFYDQLMAARSDEPKSEALDRVKALQEGLGNLKTQHRDTLMRLFLTYRGLSAWEEMAALYDLFPAELQTASMAIQQYGLALNRRARAGDREKAIRLLEKLIHDQGASAESFGILGRIYKDQYQEAKASGSIAARGALDKAIETYTRGFESEPADYYPGINAITLLAEKGDEQAKKEIDRLTPLVSFAVARRGGAASSDYWDLATVMELAAHAMDEAGVKAVLDKALSAATEGWMCLTTCKNLSLIVEMRKGARDVSWLEEVIANLESRAREIDGVQ